MVSPHSPFLYVCISFQIFLTYSLRLSRSGSVRVTQGDKERRTWAWHASIRSSRIITSITPTDFWDLTAKSRIKHRERAHSHCSSYPHDIYRSGFEALNRPQTRSNYLWDIWSACPSRCDIRNDFQCHRLSVFIAFLLSSFFPTLFPSIFISFFPCFCVFPTFLLLPLPLSLLPSFLYL